jgi:hypothetical protein
MRKIQILGAFIAVLAFSALAVASASATLWLVNSKSLVGTEKVAASSHGLLLLHLLKIPLLGGGGQVLVDCTGLFHGTVGPGAEDEITEVLGLALSEKNIIKCKVQSSTNTICVTGNEVTVQALHLPWKTLLVLEGNLTWDNFTGTGGETGYESECKGLKPVCNQNERSHFDENLANGALFLFTGERKTTCTPSGEGTVLGMGEVLGATVS